MPHVVFDNEIDLECFSQGFTELIQTKPFLIKLLDVFLDRKKKIALGPVVVIDKLHQQFLIEITTRKNKTTVRLFPGTDPEKTDGVKMSLGLTAKMISEKNPSHKITKTNIEDFLSADTSKIVLT